jgi:hypothetical protein
MAEANRKAAPAAELALYQKGVTVTRCGSYGRFGGAGTRVA